MCDESIVKRTYLVEKGRIVHVKVEYDEKQDHKIVNIKPKSFKKFFIDNDFLRILRYVGDSKVCDGYNVKLECEFDGYIGTEQMDKKFLIEYGGLVLNVAVYYPPVYDYFPGDETIKLIEDDGLEVDFVLGDMLKPYFTEMSDLRNLFGGMDIDESESFECDGYDSLKVSCVDYNLYYEY